MNAASMLNVLQISGMGALFMLFGWYLISHSDPLSDDPLTIRKGTAITRDQVPGWLYRFLTYFGQTEDSIGFITASNVAQGVLAIAAGCIILIYGVVVFVRSFL